MCLLTDELNPLRRLTWISSKVEAKPVPMILPYNDPVMCGTLPTIMLIEHGEASGEKKGIWIYFNLCLDKSLIHCPVDIINMTVGGRWTLYSLSVIFRQLSIHWHHKLHMRGWWNWRTSRTYDARIGIRMHISMSLLGLWTEHLSIRSMSLCQTWIPNMARIVPTWQLIYWPWHFRGNVQKHKGYWSAGSTAIK